MEGNFQKKENLRENELYLPRLFVLPFPAAAMGIDGFFATFILPPKC